MTDIDLPRTARKATATDRPELIRVLRAAFLDDPVFSWVVPDRAERLAVMPEVFDAFADAFARHDETGVLPGAGGAGLSAAALWAPPGAPPIHPDDEARFGERLAALPAEVQARSATVVEIFGAAHPHEPAWYLQFLGVDPAYQGRGLGSALLRDVLDAADTAGQAAYLEASSDRNRALYERHGFAHRGDLTLPDGPTAYAMWRDPR